MPTQTHHRRRGSATGWGRVVGTLFLATGSLTPASTPAQTDRAAAERQFHDRVVEILANAPTGPLPAGDTLVTWAKQGPILYHTLSASPGIVSSSLVRNDPFVGVLTTRWTDGRPTGFSVRWRQGDRTTVELAGVVSPDGLTVSGSRSQVFRTPAAPWAIADYGMDEHFVPAALTLPADGQPHAVEVLRPYALKWDTVLVAVRIDHGLRSIVLGPGAKDETRLFLTEGGRLLGQRRADGTSELRALELTPLASEPSRLLRDGDRRP